MKIAAIGGNEQADLFGRVIKEKYPGISLYTSSGYMTFDELVDKSIFYVKDCGVGVLILSWDLPYKSL